MIETLLLHLDWGDSMGALFQYFAVMQTDLGNLALFVFLALALVIINKGVNA